MRAKQMARRLEVMRRRIRSVRSARYKCPQERGGIPVKKVHRVRRGLSMGSWPGRGGRREPSINGPAAPSGHDPRGHLRGRSRSGSRRAGLWVSRRPLSWDTGGLTHSIPFARGPRCRGRRHPATRDHGMGADAAGALALILATLTHCLLERPDQLCPVGPGVLGTLLQQLRYRFLWTPLTGVRWTPRRTSARRPCWCVPAPPCWSSRGSNGGGGPARTTAPHNELPPSCPNGVGVPFCGPAPLT